MRCIFEETVELVWIRTAGDGGGGGRPAHHSRLHPL